LTESQQVNTQHLTLNTQRNQHHHNFFRRKTH